MAVRDGIRVGLLGGVLVTAYASQKATGLITSWIFHATLNPLLLFLPEVYRALSRAARLDERSSRAPGSSIAVAHGVLSDVVADNPRYVDLVGVVPAAYIFSHPRIDIYKSEWANRQLWGFGLDSIPHALTAFSLVRFVYLTLAALGRRHPRSPRVGQMAGWAERRGDWIAFGALAAATAGYETGEYLIHRSELRAVGGDPAKVAMEWSVQDTLQDIICNIVGGLAAVLSQRYSTMIRTAGRGNVPRVHAGGIK